MPAGIGRKLSDAYVELHADDSKLVPEVRVKAQRVGKEFGGQLNRSLKQLKIDPVDIKASPKDALAAIGVTEARLRELSREAESVEVKVRTETALRKLNQFRKQLGDIGENAPPIEIDDIVRGAGDRIVGSLNEQLRGLNLDGIDLNADPADALFAIQATRERLEELRDNAETLKVRINADQALGSIDQLRKRLSDAGEKGAEDFSAGFGARVGPLLARLPIGGPMLASAGILGAAIAPTIGAAIAGGIIGGAGIGGVLGGLALAKNDVRVTTAATAVGDRIEGRLLNAGGAFVKPVIEGLGQIEDAVDTIDIEGIFRNSARFVPILASGVSSAVESLGDGFEALVSRAEPVISALGSAAASFGETVGNGFELLSQDADEGASAIEDLSGAVNSLAETTFNAVHALAYFKGQLDTLDAAIDGTRHFFEDLFTSMSGGRAEFDITADGMGVAERKAKELADRNQELAEKQRATEVATSSLNESIRRAIPETNELTESTDSVAAAFEVADARIKELKDSFDALFGSQLNLDRATLAVRNGMAKLSEELRTGTRTLSLNSEEGRRNRGAVLDQVDAIERLRDSRIKHGTSLDEANRKYLKDIDGLRRTMQQAGFTKKQIDDLLGAYRKVPNKVNTAVSSTGVQAVGRQLIALQAYQTALKQGTPVVSIRKALSSDNADFLKYDTGGYTGPGPKMQVAGIVHADEFVIRKEARQRIESRNPGLLEEMNATGQLPLPGYAVGGNVRWPFPVTASRTRIPSREEVASKVTPEFGSWPSSPSAQRGDSGVWRRIVALIRATGPLSGSFGNAYRPGDPKWHGSGRAVDWMGFNQDRLASFLAAKRPLELIHRTRNRDYAYTRGVNKGSFNNALMQAHRNHIHIAMDDGGVRVLRPGMNLIPNNTGRNEPIAGPAAIAGLGGNTYSITINVPPTANLAAIGREVVVAIQAFEQNNGARWRAPVVTSS